MPPFSREQIATRSSNIILKTPANALNKVPRQGAAIDLLEDLVVLGTKLAGATFS